TAEGLGTALAAEARERQVLDREVRPGHMGRGDPAAQRRVVGFIEHRHTVSQGCGAAEPSCIQRAWVGAFLVLSHSLSMSHFTVSSAWFMAGVAVSVASSRRWPEGSRK